MLPSKDQLTICFAHVAYRLRERFLTLATGIESFEVSDGAALKQRIGEADVLVISGLWRTSTLVLARPGVVGELGMCGRSLYGNREVSRSTNSERTRAALVRIGEARSRSR